MQKIKHKYVSESMRAEIRNFILNLKKKTIYNISIKYLFRYFKGYY